MDKKNTPLSRNEVNPDFTWNLSDLCPSDEAFEKGMADTLDKIKALSAYAGKMNDENEVYSFITDLEEAEQQFERLYLYANMSLHQDMNVSKYQGYAAQMQSLAAELGTAAAFFQPELLSLTEEKLQSYAESEKLSKYRLLLSRVIRMKEHTLSAGEEAILAKSGEMASAADDIFSMLNDADLKFGEITDENGEPCELTVERYVSLMESSDRRVRMDTFKRFYEVYGQFRNTIGTAYAASIKKARFYSDVRHYDSTLEQCLDQNEVAVSVYDNLIAAVRENLGAMHKYVALRKKALGVEKHHFYDNYVSLVPEYRRKFTFEEAKETALKALAPMGRDYLSRLKEGFENRWIDVYENKGKCTGAYSWSAYGVHPYVLLNFQGELNDVFTLVHEMGHALHSMYSHETQPYTYAGYKIFVAEVASTVNEALTMRYMLSICTDKKEKAYLINHFIDMFKGTLYRQTMFAEFEKKAHEMYAKGEAVTTEALCDVYRELNRDYFGEDMVIDEEIALEWLRIPHFYSEFYVYQYATGFAAAVALSEKILTEGESAAEAYIRFLRSGCTDTPTELLKIAGVDMTSPEPVKDALRLFDELVEELEELLEE